MRIPTPRNPNQNRAAVWRFFSSNNSAPANRKTGGWIHFCMKRLRTLKSFQIIKSKTYSGWCPTKWKKLLFYLFLSTASSLGHSLLLAWLEEAVRASYLAHVAFRFLQACFSLPPLKLQ
jgi:hypothetical protein